jgi:1-deoxy-D-xylulose-5-phosphate synthase
LEEGCVVGGAGSAVAEALAEMGLSLPLLHLGVPDRFTEHGDPQALLSEMGLDAAGVQRSVRARWPELVSQERVLQRVS